MAKAKKLPSGNWRTQVYLGKDATGKPIVESFTASTARESERLAAVAAADRKRKKKQTLTLGQAMDEFIDTCRYRAIRRPRFRRMSRYGKTAFRCLSLYAWIKSQSGISKKQLTQGLKIML